MVKLVFFVFFALFTVLAMLFTAAEARKLHHLKAATHKKESISFVVPSLQLKKRILFPEDKCFFREDNKCLTLPTGNTCTDPDCVCATTYNPTFPAVCIERDCGGRRCETNANCWEPICTCSFDNEFFVEADIYFCVPAQGNAGESDDEVELSPP